MWANLSLTTLPVYLNSPKFNSQPRAIAGCGTMLKEKLVIATDAKRPILIRFAFVQVPL